jgi:NAD(P)H-hydrate repair Nnr-like enzyme with NAD(P)H-hydrate epimerase domain
VSKHEYKDQFNTIANNWRFCFKKSIKNAGTQVLKQLRQKAPAAWKAKYGDELKHIITFVGAGKNGAVYLADNWKKIGETAGLPPHQSSSMKWHDNAELKKLFVKPTGENKKIILIKTL